MHEENAKLLDALHKCALECDYCYDACLNEHNIEKMRNCIRINRACAEVCHLAASFVASGSVVKGQLLETCAEICEICASECDMHDTGHCQRCAEACRACAEACRKG